MNIVKVTYPSGSNGPQAPIPVDYRMVGSAYTQVWGVSTDTTTQIDLEITPDDLSNTTPANAAWINVETTTAPVNYGGPVCAGVRVNFQSALSAALTIWVIVPTLVD